MKISPFLPAILLTSTTLVGQVNYSDTSFYSPALDKEKLVRIYLPPDNDDNQDLHNPVIYFLHGLGANHRAATGQIKLADSLITNGVIEPVIMVGADNSCEPLDKLGLPSEFYHHDGDHSMPKRFIERGLMFLDSYLLSPRE